MKIKLAILEKDQIYLERIVSVFNMKYADRFQVYSFTEVEGALQKLEETKIDVLVANEMFDVDVDALPSRCGFAYFVESPDVETLNNQKVICKFQKVEQIYRQILSIYSENAGIVTKFGEDSGNITIFTSPCGGVGTSSMAAAYALYLASQGNKTIYINLENFGSADVFFAAEGQFDMSDIIYALKSKKTNLAMKLESCVKQDPRGVYFFSQTKVALDMFELSPEEIATLLSEIRIEGEYDNIIIDMDFSLSKDALALMKEARSVVLVSDGSNVANRKLRRAVEAIQILDQGEDAPLSYRLELLYNKFSNKTCTMLDDLEIRNPGGAPRYEHATEQQVLEQLAQLDAFAKLK